MKKDLHSSILLGRPFLVTTGVDINVRSEKNSLNLRKEKIEFVVMKYDKEPPDNFCYRVEVIDSPRKEKSITNIKEEPPEAAVRHNVSVNTSGAKDRVFRATHGNFRITIRIK
jgi:hypothetical protein